MAYIYPISFKVGQLIIDNEGKLCAIKEVEFLPATAKMVDGKIEITDGAYDVLLTDSAGNEQLWSYSAGEYTVALLGEQNAMRQ